MLCAIVGGNWNNTTNAGVGNVNWNNTRTNSNDNVGFRADCRFTPRNLKYGDGGTTGMGCPALAKSIGMPVLVALLANVQA